jgi:beta-phosphoglucomutase-like phosphatase (HAD superfamily)
VLRAIVFDFDGVIANSEPLHLRCYQDVLADVGFTLSARDYYARYLGFDDEGAFKAMAVDRGLSWSDAEISRLITAKMARMEALERDVSVLFPGASDAIRRAAAAAPLAIASGALGVEIRRVLDRDDLARYFVAIVSADDTPIGKPAPDPYLLAVARLGEAIGPVAPSQCVAIEDSHWGLQSARAAGLRTVAVAHTYDEAQLIDADLVIGSIDRLDLEALSQLCAA